MTVNDLLPRLKGTIKTASGFSACCPAHDDRKPSLSVGIGADGRILLKCQAGCSFDAICAALHIEAKDLFPERNGGHSRSRIVAAYDYTDETGKLLFQCVRFEPKDFRQRQPDPSAKDGWAWNLKGVRRVLYRLPEVLGAISAGDTVVVCEGEKDADALAKQGFCGTCNPMGAGKWEDTYSDNLRGADVIILPDKDGPDKKYTGQRHAEQVADSLSGKAKRVRVVTLPDVPNAFKLPVKDASNFFDAGGTAEDLRALIDAAPDWIPGTKIAPEVKPEAKAEPTNLETKAGPADIRGQIIAILTDGNLSAVEAKSRIARAVVEALTARGRFYFHAERRDFDSAMFFDGDRKRLERVQSDAFQAWLSEWLAVNRADTLFKYVLAQVETSALSNRSTPILPEAYWTSRPGGVYLSSGDGQIVRATAHGLAVVDNGTDGVLFAAGRTLGQWSPADPVDPFEVCTLFKSAHCAAGHGLDLLRIWLYSLPTNPRSKPPICLAGDIGSGKTRTAKGIAELYGLPFIASKVEDEAEHDFWPNLDQGGLLTLDNADSRCKWLADALANAATDGCSQRRKLYTDSETVTLRARAWICVTTANPLFASDAGLADRLLVIRMNRHDGSTSDAQLTDEILAIRDGALTHIAETIARALPDMAPTPTGLNSRHPDFAAFAVRLGRALGRESQSVAALQAAELDKAAFCLENDPVASALLAYLRNAQMFTGTAAELAAKLSELEPDLKERLSAKRLSKRLSALWPHLEKVLDVAEKITDRKGFTVFTLAAAEFAEIETAFSENLSCKEENRTFRKTASETRQTRQSDDSDPDLPL